jgi:GT2 family glycosyltransferase
VERPVVDVTAVLVAHDGAEWLPEALAALAASSVAPAAVVCVDTGSTDSSVALLEQAYGSVVRLPRESGYPQAVAAGLAAAPRSGWVWLLHDDLAVEPGTLEALLEHAATSPSAALLGPKARDWYDPRQLVEVGVTTDAAGHRETGLERHEHDQGQHDAIRDVLAVGTAGALVRREVWDQVGGLDPQLPVFRDDLDLGWKVNAAGHRAVVVPRARVRHARAATTGRREPDAAPGRASGTDRRHALYVLLAHASLLRLLGLLPRLVVATAVRALLLLLTRQVGAARDEAVALLSVLGHPARLREARRARAATRTVSQRELRPLFASRTLRIRARLGAMGDWLGGGAPVSSTLGALGDPGPEGPDVLDFEAGPGLLRSLLLRPGVLLFLSLSVVATIAERGVLALHHGTLYGGALLTPPSGAHQLWASYTASWHDVSVGSSATPPPSTAVLAALSTLALGKPWVVVDTLLLVSVPLAGVTAYLAATRMVRHLYLRLWAAATWALLPVATGAVAAGRLDAAAVQIVLPPLVLGAGRVLTTEPRARGWWRVWGLGLALALTCALAPLLWPLAALVLLVGAGVNVALGRRLRALACAVVAVTPLLVLFPWSLSALAHPSLFVAGQQPADPDLPAWHLLALSPGGPGVPAALLTVGVLLAALGGLVRVAYRRLAQVSWGVALLGLGAAGVLARVQVGGAAVWPGLALQLAALALLVAALVAGNGVRARLGRHTFGWRQVMALAVAAVAAAVPVLAALSWLGRGADDPLRRDGRQLLPAFALADLRTGPGLRALALSPRPDGRLGYVLLEGDGQGLQNAGLRADATQRQALDRIVADLASPRGSDAAAALSTRAVRYVVLRSGPGREDLAAALDTQSGLVRRSAGAVDLWQVASASTRLSVLPPRLAAQAGDGRRAPSRDVLRSAPPVVLPAGGEGARATLPAGPPGRLLVLADARDRRWHATVDGVALAPRTAWGWAQAFALPPTGGHLVLSHAHAGRRTSLVVQGLLVLAVVVLSAPAGRRRRGLEEDDEDDDTTREGDVPRTKGRRLPVAAL